VTRTKYRQRPAPRRRTGASRKEVKTLIPGHARGAEAFLMMRRKGGRWAVLDTFRGDPVFVGAGTVWVELKPDTPDVDLYRWTEAQARALTAHFVDDAVVVARNNRALDAAAEVVETAVRAARTARRVESLAADMAPPEVMPQVLTLEQVAARLQVATAEVAARMGKAHAPEPAAGFTVPAAMDRPDWQPPKPDPTPDRRLLSRKAMDIAANCEDATVGLPLLRVHGPEATAVFPALPPDAPPLPPGPPTVHLEQVHPDAGRRISERVAAAVGAAT